MRMYRNISMMCSMHHHQSSITIEAGSCIFVGRIIITSPFFILSYDNSRDEYIV